jgi:tRNA threonylcarbamoyladenosine biosynthesis protein TsaE
MDSIDYFLKNEAATLRLGTALAQATFQPSVDLAVKALPGEGVASVGGIIHLHGELGAGKTTLTRGILRGYGYQGAVKSPTYTLVEPYEFTACHIYHFDLYRLGAPEEVEYLGTEDYFSGQHLCLIEWAERGAGVIPAADIEVSLTAENKGRRLHWLSRSEKGRQIGERMWAAGRNL